MNYFPAESKVLPVKQNLDYVSTRPMEIYLLARHSNMEGMNIGACHQRTQPSWIGHSAHVKVSRPVLSLSAESFRIRDIGDPFSIQVQCCLQASRQPMALALALRATQAACRLAASSCCILVGMHFDFCSQSMLLCLRVSFNQHDPQHSP